MSFSQLKKRTGDFSSLTSKLEKDKSGGYENDGDKDYWRLTVDDAGNGYAVIRFLPEVDGEEYPYVILYQHQFKDERTNKWYIENSRTTIGETDPVAEANSELWTTGLEANKNLARKRKRNKYYISNILVIKDPKNPDNEGKQFKFKYGARIFNKIEQALKPEFPDEKPFNPFDLWKGADFKLKARIVDKQRSYDASSFDAPAPLFGGDDEALEKLWKAEFSLKAEIAPDKFKSYDDLKARFLKATGQAGGLRNDTPARTETKSTEAAMEGAVKAEAPKATKPVVDEEDLNAKYAALLDD